MTIYVDSREKSRVIANILEYFDSREIKHISTKLYVGDYQRVDNPFLVIDRKHDLAELCANVSTVPKKDKDGRIKRAENGRAYSEWTRFTDELARASDLGIKVIILCEHGGAITSLDRVPQWKNPRCKKHPYAIDGRDLYRKLLVLKNQYNVQFEFCNKRQTGKRIVELLS